MLIKKSDYPRNQSTDTSTLKIFNDFASAVDSTNLYVLYLLALSMAFDTIDHDEAWIGLW